MVLGAFPPIYLGEDLIEITSCPFPWQQTLNHILANEVHPREIMWVFDPMGETGKSTYVKYHVFKQKAHVLSWDSQRDLFFARRSNKDKRIVFFDFTRSTPKFVDTNEIFSSIESIKNGLMFSAKYESNDVITAIPHVVCMSNYLPSDPSLLSTDRWLLTRIRSTTKDIYAMSAREANEFIKDYQDHEIKQEANKKHARWLYEQNHPSLDRERTRNKGKEKSSRYKQLFFDETDQNPENYIAKPYKPSKRLLERWGD